MNTSKLCRKRRAQMLAGKLGHAAGVTARLAYSSNARILEGTDGLGPLLHEPGRVTLERYKILWLQTGKTVKDW